MGWDAQSSANYTGKGFTDPLHTKTFKKAVHEVLMKTGQVDGLLQYGGLGCSECQAMLQKATTANCYEDWTIEETLLYAATADWTFYFEPEKAWAYWSARVFLETCANLGLSVSFYY